jgi:hypothetical protein
MSLMKKGVVDGQNDYSVAQKQHLIECIGKWRGNLYIWYK